MHIAKVKNESTLIVHSENMDLHFDPEKTIYDMRVLNLKEDSIVLCVKEEAMQTLVFFENELGWILTSDLQVV